MESTVRFTKPDFEKALGEALRATVNDTGYDAKLNCSAVQSEWQYFIRIQDTNKRICIRSSIPSQSERANETGKNSIRIWGQYWYPKTRTWIPLKKIDRWTTRVPGWEKRLASKLHQTFVALLEDTKLPIPKTQDPTPAQEDVTQKPSEIENDGMDGARSSCSGAGVEGLIALGDERAEIADGKTTVETHSLIPLGKMTDLVMDEDDESQEVLPKIANPFQAEAIALDLGQAARVLAPPGSGKTFVIERRVAHLLSKGVEPRHIFAVTFTASMAEEAYKRVKALNPQIAGSALEDQICTIHALCYRILRKEGDFRRKAETWKVKKAIQEKAKQLWPSVEQRPGWKEIYSWIVAPKGMGLGRGEDADFYFDHLGNYHGSKLFQTRAHFDATMKRENLLTFPDMLLDCELLLRDNKEAREKWQAAVKYMIVDEGQDTSGQAMRVLTELAKPQDNFFVVGDSDQMMFRFAGAAPESNLFEGFETRYPSGEMVHLGVNYRSTRTIVDAQMKLITHNYESNGGPYADKYLKDVSPRENAPEGDPITWNEYTGPQEEAAAVVAAIVEELANSGAPGEIFVGSRTRAQLGYLEGPLVKAGIPYINITGGSFWTLHHIGLAVDYLRLAFDESNKVAFKKVYNIGSKWSTHPWGDEEGQYCSHRYLGRAFMSAVGEDYREAKGKFFGRELRRSFMPGVEDLVGFVQDLQAEMAASDSVRLPLEMIINDCLKDYIRHEDGIVNDEDAGQFDDFETLMEVAAGFESVEAFLKYVDEAKRQAELVKDKDWGQYVVLSTVHRLKGLERNTVYGIGLSEGTSKRTGEPRGLLPHTFSMIAPPNDGILPTGGMGRIEDELCICFVLVSRARSRVHLSGVRNYRDAEMWPSRFVAMLGCETGRNDV